VYYTVKYVLGYDRLRITRQQNDGMTLRLTSFQSRLRERSGIITLI
jgi:hypothetical protein